MMQLDLLAAPMARRTDPQTSHQAAESMRERAPNDHALILDALGYHAMGKDAIARHTGLSGVAVARRLPELERQGRVTTTGRSVTSNTGRAEREWTVVYRATI